MRSSDFGPGPEHETFRTPELYDERGMCFGEECPKFSSHLEQGGGSAEDLQRSCARMGGTTGRPGEEGFQCGVLASVVLYPVEGDETNDY